MVGSILVLVAQYNLDAGLKAQQIMSFMFEPKMLSKLTPDIVDMGRLSQANPQTITKSAQAIQQQLCEYAESCPEFIGKVQLYGDREIFKYIRIIENFQIKIVDLTNQTLAISKSMVDVLLSGLLMTIMLQINLLFQIIHLILVDVFWTILSMALKAVWMAYASTLMSGSYGYWPSPLTGVMVIMLAGVQLAIEAEYLAYIFIKIAMYILNTVIAILLVMIIHLAWIVNLVLGLLFVAERLLEQIAGLAGTIPCIPIITMAQKKAIADLTIRTTGALACIS